MTDPQHPDAERPSTQPPSYAPPPAPAYSAGNAPAPADRPGRTLGIVAFVLSFFVQPVALVLGIVALVQSRRAGEKNGFALAAVIISAVLIVLATIILIVVFAVVLPATFSEIARLCAEYGPGEHVIDGVTVNLTCP